MKISKVLLSLAFGFFISLVVVHHACAEKKAPSDKKVFFKNLKEGQTVTSPVKVEMGVQGMLVVPAGQVKKGEGHHHIIVDGKHVKKGEVIAKDETHLHFGAGQTEASIPLTSGKHTLTLQFANGAHRSYGKKLAATVTVNVKG